MLRSAFARRPALAAVTCASALALALPATAAAGNGGVGSTDAPPPPVKGSQAKLTPSGEARAPKNAPQEVVDARSPPPTASTTPVTALARWPHAGARAATIAPARPGYARPQGKRVDSCTRPRTRAPSPAGARGTDHGLHQPGHAYAVIAGSASTPRSSTTARRPRWSKDVGPAPTTSTSAVAATTSGSSRRALTASRPSRGSRRPPTALGWSAAPAARRARGSRTARTRHRRSARRRRSCCRSARRTVRGRGCPRRRSAGAHWSVGLDRVERREPLTKRSNAIRLPSGDQVGCSDET